MDTSETYIRMCKQAKEIQTLKVQYFQEHGNFFGDSVTPRPTWLISCDICFDLVTAEKNAPGRFIFLPRQDQLQMVLETPPLAYSSPFQMTRDFLKFIEGNYYSVEKGTRYYSLGSMEQLWLAFVMAKRYKKVWDGGDWRHAPEGGYRG